MKKYYPFVRNAVIIALIWTGVIALTGQYLLHKHGTQPTFPYYNTLLEEGSSEQAIFAHFDGAHYLHLAKFGYDGTGVQAFFPVYPLLIHIVHEYLGLAYIAAGRLISLISLIGSLTCLAYLYKQRFRTIALAILLFPTSFFLASMYTESLFLFEVLLFFVLLKRRSYVAAACLAGVASGTRLVGSLLSLSLLLELYPAIKAKKYFSVFTLLLMSVSGILAYMAYLNQRYGDPLIFLHVQSLFGAERSSGEIIWLPQVLARYARMIVTVDPSTWLYRRVWLELICLLSAVWLWYKNLHKIPLAQSLFVGFSLLIPTLSGTLSSYPRYCLILVPFLVPAKAPRQVYVACYLVISTLLLYYLLSLFVSGQFVS